jgi:hypothetical protein
MGNRSFRNCGVGAIVLLCAALAAVCQAPPPVPSAEDAKSVPNASLSVEQIVNNLQKKNAERAAALLRYEATRVYRMHYRGFPSDREAEMVVTVDFHAPNSKQFHLVSQTGSKFIIDHVFNKLLEGEQEAADNENRRHTALSTENYDFTSAGYESTPDGGRYVLNLLPRTKNKFLYRGQIWIDAKDFAVVRIKGEPGKNPSFWIKKTDIEHRYVKVNGFWLPAENHTESVIRLGGVATLSIEYKDYKITKTASVHVGEALRSFPDAALISINRSYSRGWE